MSFSVLLGNRKKMPRSVFTVFIVVCLFRHLHFIYLTLILRVICFLFAVNVAVAAAFSSFQLTFTSTDFNCQPTNTFQNSHLHLFFTVPAIGVDVGGTLTKLVYFEPNDEDESGGELEAKVLKNIRRYLTKHSAYGNTGHRDIHLQVSTVKQINLFALYVKFFFRLKNSQ
jgi:hypothetical protein